MKYLQFSELQILRAFLKTPDKSNYSAFREKLYNQKGLKLVDSKTEKDGDGNEYTVFIYQNKNGKKVNVLST